MAYTYDAYDPNKKPPATTTPKLYNPATPATVPTQPSKTTLRPAVSPAQQTAVKPAATTLKPAAQAAQPAQGNFWDQYGGKDAYTTSQLGSFAAATKSGDQALISRLQADAKRVGYTLPPTGEKIPPSESFSGELPPTGQPGQQPQQDPLSMENIQEVFRGMFSEMEVVRQQATAEQMGYLSQMTNNWMGEFNTAFAQVTAMFQEQLGGMDPATQMALDRIKKDAKEYRDRMMEDMSRRGLLQSGIAIQSDIKLQEGQLNAEQQLLATRVSDIQNRMTSALMNFATMRLDAMKQYGLVGVDLSVQAGNQSMENMRSAMGSAFQLAGMQESQRQFDTSQAEGTRQFDTSQAEGTRQFDLTYEQRDKQFAEQMALSKEQMEADAKRLASQQGLDWARLSESQKQNMIDNAYREKYLAWQKEQADKGDASDYATRTALTELKDYKTRGEAMAALTQGDRWQRMIQQGVDMQKLLAEINKLPEKKTFDQEFMSGIKR